MDGFVERFNRTLTAMLSNTVQKDGRNWDDHFPYVLFAYETSIQQSTAESPFYLLYGHDAHLPTEAALVPIPTQYPITWKTTSHRWWSHWAKHGNWLRRVSKRHNEDKSISMTSRQCPTFVIGDHVFVHACSKGKAHKFARLFKGPYWVLATYNNGVELQMIECPNSQPSRVALNHVCHCPTQISCKDDTGLTEQMEFVYDDATTNSEEDINEPLSVQHPVMSDSSHSNPVLPEDTRERGSTQKSMGKSLEEVPKKTARGQTALRTGKCDALWLYCCLDWLNRDPVGM